MNKEEKLDIEEIEDTELFQESDPVEKAKAESKKKKKNGFLDFKGMSTKDKVMYGGGALLIVVAAFMMMDNGDNAKVDHEKATKNFQKSGDIYSQSKSAKAEKATPVTKSAEDIRKQRLMQEARMNANVIKTPQIQLNSKTINSKKDADVSFGKKEQSQYAIRKETSFKTNKTQSSTMKKAQKLEKKKVRKKEVPYDLSKRYSYTVEDSAATMRCYSTKGTEPLYKILNNHIIAPYKHKVTHQTKLDGKLLRATIKGKTVMFVQLESGDAVYLKKDRVYCDMDNRGEN